MPCSSQFVGQKLPLSTVKGKPLVQRAMPESSQPPMRASVAPPELLAKCLPLPNGSSAIQFRLIWCGVSKSETPRRDSGEKAFANRLPGAPTFVLELYPKRVALEVKSMDFEYV